MKANKKTVVIVPRGSMRKKGTPGAYRMAWDFSLSPQDVVDLLKKYGIAAEIAPYREYD